MAFELWTGKEEKERHHGLFKVDCVWNVMERAQKSDFVFRRKGRVHLNQRGRQFSRLLAAEMCATAVVVLDTPCSEVVWSVLDTHSIRFSPSLPLPCVTVCHHVSTGVYNPKTGRNEFQKTTKYLNQFRNESRTCNVPTINQKFYRSDKTFEWIDTYWYFSAHSVPVSSSTVHYTIFRFEIWG
jgi:hypothetical protein